MFVEAGPRASWHAVAHGGPVHTLKRNPFFQDVLLSVGGWNFNLWREGNLVSGRLLLLVIGTWYY